MVSIRKRLSRLTWVRIVRMAALILLFFVGFDIVLAKAQYVVVPSLGRRNPKDSSAYVQLCYESLPKKASHKRIFFFGDSTVQGSTRILQEDAIPAQLEVELRKRPGWEDVRVYNFGLVGALPVDLLTAFLMFREHECTAVVIEVSHRKFGTGNDGPKRISFLSLLSNFDRSTLEASPPLGDIYHTRGILARWPESLTLALRRVWFFYRFRGVWRGYFHTYDFKRRVGGKRKHKQILGWQSGLVKLIRFIPLRNIYIPSAETVQDKDDPSAKIFKRIFEIAEENNIALKIFLGPFDFKFMVEELEIDVSAGKDAIVRLNRIFGELMEPMPPGWDFGDYTESLEYQVNFIDQEHLIADGCGKLAKLLADDFFSEPALKKTK
ncbi:MAG: hypothetical protein E3J72_17675 [Planctomycetota bacterium]|nr:MAG: hypothetical protein E3J72_17675 [Planctomycetota bacterium]